MQMASSISLAKKGPTLLFQFVLVQLQIADSAVLDRGELDAQNALVGILSKISTRVLRSPVLCTPSSRYLHR